jgi:tRNA threonylcarbamoyladenosine biosynthesis protein TsaB
MNILGIDTSTDNCSVGIVSDGKVLGRNSQRGRSMASERLIALITELTGQTITFQQIDALAVSIGPGSYTGLRIGLSTAKGLAYDRKLPILPVSTMAVLESVARLELTTDLVLLIKSHRNLAYHVFCDSRKRLNPYLDSIGYATFSDIVKRYGKQCCFVSPSELKSVEFDVVHRVYPEGDHVAQLAYRHYEQLIQLHRSDLEPMYYSEFEAQKWQKPTDSKR